MKRTHQEVAGSGSSKAKMTTAEDGIQDAGDDELLAALGYKVRSSDMADVAQKLEQLEMAMAAAGTAVEENTSPLTHLAYDTVHYNPSDLSSWLENILSELNVPPPPPKQETYDASDLTAIVPAEREKKRIKSETMPAQPAAAVVLVEEPQEAGVRLVHTLLACGAAVQEENLTAAAALVKEISVLAMSQSGPMRKVATFFAEALARRIYRIHPSPPPASITGGGTISDVLESHFYEACPYLKFAHFTANQAILEAFSGKSRVHVVDFGMKQGIQWPALMQALALRPGGPPVFRLTGIGPPQSDSSDALQQVGWKLAEIAETIGIEFEYRGFVAASLADLEPYMFEIPTGTDRSSSDEAVAVNSMFELHRLLGQPGAIEKVLATVKAMNPIIVTVVEQEANHNAPVFLDRFNEALHYYSSMFDSLEGSTSMDVKDQAMSEVYLGRQICDIVACEGADRTERHETAEQWRRRIVAGGFEPVPFGSNAFKQASMLLELFAGADGYRVEEREGYLMLGWHTRPLVTASAWRIPAAVA